MTGVQWEATCSRCGVTFVPDGPEDRHHDDDGHAVLTAVYGWRNAPSKPHGSTRATDYRLSRFVTLREWPAGTRTDGSTYATHWVLYVYSWQRATYRTEAGAIRGALRWINRTEDENR